MVVGIGKLVFRLHDCRSLKAKRKVIKAIVRRIDNHFNVSVAEVGDNDIYQRALVGFAVVGNSGALVNAKLDKIINLVYDLNLVEIIDSEMELIHL
jgi:uncharacterized protein YlxP (DUF503 family)